MPKVVSVINLKGGVGKTQMTVSLAEFLVVQHSKKVLVIDLDPQTNATVMLMSENAWLQRNQAGHTLVQLFRDKLENTSRFSVTASLVTSASNIRGGLYFLHLLPSSLDLIAIQDRLVLIQAGTFYVGSPVTVLKEALAPILDDYDFVLIDCPPNLGILTLNGLYMSDYFLVPVIPDVLSTYGVPQILDRVSQFSQEAKTSIQPLGIVVSRYRAQAQSLHDDTIRRLRADPRLPRLWDVRIRDTINAARAPEFSRHVNTLKQKYGYGDSVYNDYEALAREFLSHV